MAILPRAETEVSTKALAQTAIENLVQEQIFGTFYKNNRATFT